MSKFARFILVFVLCLGGLAVSSTVATPSAGAATTYSVYNTSGDGLWLHPDSSNIYSAVSDLMPDGTGFDITCWTYGDDVNGDNVWDYGTNESSGNSGYAADFHINTPVHQAQEGPELTALGIPNCADAGTSGGQQVSPSGTGGGWAPYCGGNDYVAEVQVQDYTQGQFDIQVTPTSNARYAELSGFGPEATNEIWHAVQACVSGLYGTLADGIYEQIQCHVIGGLLGPINAGGATYDLETWRPPVSWNVALSSECNWLGWPYAPLGEPYRPDQLGNQPTF